MNYEMVQILNNNFVFGWTTNHSKSNSEIFPKITERRKTKFFPKCFLKYRKSIAFWGFEYNGTLFGIVGNSKGVKVSFRTFKKRKKWPPPPFQKPRWNFDKNSEESVFLLSGNQNKIMDDRCSGSRTNAEIWNYIYNIPDWSYIFSVKTKWNPWTVLSIRILLIRIYRHQILNVAKISFILLDREKIETRCVLAL